MFNSDLLKYVMKRNHIQMDDLSKKLGFSRQSLYKRLNEEVEFRLTEIKTITEFCGLSDQEVHDIFLLNKSTGVDKEDFMDLMDKRIWDIKDCMSYTGLGRKTMTRVLNSTDCPLLPRSKTEYIVCQARHLSNGGKEVTMKRYRLNKATLAKNLLIAFNVAFIAGTYLYVILTLPQHLTTL